LAETPSIFKNNGQLNKAKAAYLTLKIKETNRHETQEFYRTRNSQGKSEGMMSKQSKNIIGRFLVAHHTSSSWWLLGNTNAQKSNS